MEEASIPDMLATLERFVVDNDDLLNLESLIGRFNVFDALGIARAEIRHSNFLAFLLDPAESHGQSQLFLRAILMDLLKRAPAELRPLSPIEIDDADLRGVEVRREWNGIDLLITGSNPAFVVVVENKVDSGEHSNQLVRYRETIERQYPAVRPLYVFLTPHGDEPSESEWVPYRYADLHRVLLRVRNTSENAIGDDVLVFLDHYLNLIGTRFMDDAKLDDLCHRIYKNHRQALQLIYDRVGSPTSGIASEVEAVVVDDDRWHLFHRSGSIVDFLPATWIPWMPPLGLDSKEQPKSWIIMRFEVYERSLDFYVEVRRIADIARRRSIIDALLAHGDQYGLKRKQKGEVQVKDSYTRLSSREKVLTWAEGKEPEATAVRAAVEKKLDERFLKSEELGSAIRTLLEFFNTGQSSP